MLIGYGTAVSSATDSVLHLLLSAINSILHLLLQTAFLSSCLQITVSSATDIILHLLFSAINSIVHLLPQITSAPAADSISLFLLTDNTLLPGPNFFPIPIHNSEIRFRSVRPLLCPTQTLRNLVIPPQESITALLRSITEPVPESAQIKNLSNLLGYLHRDINYLIVRNVTKLLFYSPSPPRPRLPFANGHVLGQTIELTSDMVHVSAIVPQNGRSRVPSSPRDRKGHFGDKKFINRTGMAAVSEPGRGTRSARS